MTDLGGFDHLLARCRFPDAGTAVDCAVSGGADSLALLVLACAAGLQVTAWHVDHALRPGSAAEALQVQAAAIGLGAAFRAVAAPVPPGPNLESRARDLRWAALPRHALTGHTADDQAETVLLNLVRGAGLDGLAGMRTGGHPLLGLRRAETHAVCAQAGLTPLHDPSNDDLAFRRNRVRHHVLPLLARTAERDVAGVIARQAEHLRDDADLLTSLAAGLDPTDIRALTATAPSLARRALRTWLTLDHPPDAASVDRVLAVARGEIRSTEVVGGRRVLRRAGRLVLVVR